MYKASDTSLSAKHRIRVMFELLLTEETYVKGLENVINVLWFLKFLLTNLFGC